MHRMTPALISILLLLSSATAFCSSASLKGLHELDAHFHHAETELKHAGNLNGRIAIVQKFRHYVAHELEKQRSVTQPDATDDRLALSLIGFDEDLGSFIDEPSHDFSEAKCAGHRIALIHSYTPAGEARAPANLPLHTQESLKILELLCGN